MAATVVLEQDGLPKCLGLHLQGGAVLTARHCVRRYPRLALRGTADGRSTEIVEALSHPVLDLALIRGALTPSVQALDLTQILDTPPTPGARARAIFTDDGRLGVVEGRIESAQDELVVGYGASRGPCNGDSGAALLIEQGEDWYVGGVLRGGARGCRGPDRYVRADVVRGWLSENFRKEDMSDDSRATREVRRLTPREKQ